MTARNTKLNGAELLKRLGVTVLAEAAPRMVHRVPFISIEGNGSGEVGMSAEGVRKYLADLRNPEQDRAATLRRVNVRPASRSWETAVDTLTLSRRILGRWFRAWRSSGHRAVLSWQTEEGSSSLSRLRVFAGVLPLALDLPKLEKVRAEGENAPAAYLNRLGVALPYVGSSYWGNKHLYRTQRLHWHQQVCIDSMIDAMYEGKGWQRLSMKEQYRNLRRMVRGRTPEEYLEEYLAKLENIDLDYLEGSLKSLRRQFTHQLREAARHNIEWLRKFLRLLKQAVGGYLGYTTLILADFSRIHQASIYALSQSFKDATNAEKPPRPPDLLPLPPAAPLAPPA